ncbi:Uncharacterised protein [Mycobacteroides abscessus subsp. abscessus]|nr:Uncharacterised protein [Mycobacteroides abscessus subsp. abscessus]
MGRARIADFELIGDGRSLTGYIGLDPIGRGCFRDDAAYGVDGLVGQRLALISGDIDLHVGGLTVLALRAPCRDRIAPVIGNMLNVFVVVIQALHQRVIELMCLRAKGFFAFKYHHRRAVRVEFVEHLADMPHRQCRRCVGRVQRGRSFLADHFQLGDGRVGHCGNRYPEQHDGDGKPADDLRRT